MRTIITIVIFFVLLHNFCWISRDTDRYAGIENKIRYMLFQAFAANPEIPDCVVPTVDLHKSNETEDDFNIKLDIGFDINKRSRSYSANLENFNNGEYLIEHSPIGNTLLNELRISLNKYFQEELGACREVSFGVYGYADATPFRQNSRKRYLGDFGNFPSANNSHRFYDLANNQTKPIKLDSLDKLNNENLAFLRAYGMERYVRETIFVGPFSNIKKTFQIYVKVEKKHIGPEYRKVKITVEMIKIKLEH